MYMAGNVVALVSQNFYDKAIELDSNYSIVYNNKGGVLHELKYAINCCYDNAIELDPKCSNAYHNKGLVLKELDALNCFDRAIELDPDEVEKYQKILKIIFIHKNN